MSFLRAIAASLLILFISVPASGPAMGQQPAPLIRQIVIEGTQRIEPGTVRSYLLVQEGDLYDPRRVDQSLKNLFATGLFADVTIRRQGDALIVRLVENPVINRIAFEGNQRVKDESLETEIQLRPRVVFTRTKVQSDVKRILDIYRVNGRFAATVDPKVIRLDQNRVDLVFEIDEGPLTRVENIRFVGNRVMDDSDLKEVVRTKETAWYRFFSSDDTYDPDRLTFDRELLRRFYLSEGYADFRVRSAVAELTPERNAFYITFTVEEGSRYKFGDINIASSLKGLETETLQNLLEFEKGDWYDSDLVEKAVENITDEVGELGFAFVEVRPRVDRNRDTRVINLDFQVNEGPRVFVERINISGNVRTVDKVIRREFRLVEGDAFNSAKLRRSRQRIQNLGYFAKVDVERIPGSSNDKAIINVEVEEQSTGSFSVGVGYSTDAGPLADLSVRERNLLGRGKELGLSLSIAAERSEIDLSITEPYFLDREIRAGFDVFHRTSDRQDTSSFDSKSTGFGVRAGYEITEELRQDWRYQFDRSVIENVSSTASSLIKRQEGTRYVSGVSHAVLYDRRNSRFAPSDGYFGRLTTDLAGFGGTVFYLRNTAQSGIYFPVADDWTLSVSGRAGYIVGLGEDVEIVDRYFLGGQSLRGFETAGAGPRDRVTDDSLGGEWIYNGTVELTMPLGLPNEFNIKGRVFSDFGSVGGVNPSNANVFDTGSVRASVGAGLGWASPFGPIAVDFGVPVLKESLDKDELIRVNFGTRF